MSVNIKQSGSLKQIAAFLPNNLITISSLPDTDITNIQTGQSLVYNGELSKWVNYSAKIILTYDNYFQGEIITCTQGQTVISKTAPLSGNTLVFYVNAIGTWVIANGDFSVSAVVSAVGDIVSAELQSVPQGSTVTPTDDIQTWLKCANITDKSYTTLSEVLADRETFETLIANSNACDYMARSTTWAGFNGSVGRVPTMTSNNTPSGEAFFKNEGTGYPAWKMFDGNTSSRGADCDVSGTTPVWWGYKFTSPVIVNRLNIKIYAQSGKPSSFAIKLQGSNDGTTYTDIDTEKSISNLATNAQCDNTLDFINSTAYLYYRCYTETATFIHGSYLLYVDEMQFYSNLEGIATNQDAMSLIGKYDYCSNALLGNAIWASAIANSEYVEEVIQPCVPKMTSATAPYGQVISDSDYSGQPAWQAFDGNSSTTWTSNKYSSASGQCYCGYIFTEKKAISEIKGLIGKSSIVASTNGGKFQYYDGTDWIDIPNTVIPEISTNNTVDIDFILDEPIICNGVRMFQNIPKQYGTIGIYELQFYGRAEKAIYSPKVPTMTSDTQPSGEAVGSTADSGLQLYRMFNKNSMDCYSTVPNTPTTGFYAGYKFNTATVINKLSIMTTFWHTNSSSAYYDLGIYGGDSLDNLTKLSTTNLRFTSTTSLTAQTTQELTFDNDTAYLYYVLKFESASSGIDYMKLQSTYIFMIWELQFYSKASATNLVHSCANDTLYYYDSNDTAVTLCTTDENGDGVIDYGSLDAGYYTIYSTVAKDPSNLSNAYSKTVRITNTLYGHTTEAYIMPDAVKTLYWWGYQSDNLEECTSANGWTFNYTFKAPIYNTNDITLTGASNYYCAVGNKNPISGTPKTIAQGVTGTNSSYGQIMNGTSKVMTSYSEYLLFDTASTKLYSLANEISNGYANIIIANARSSKVYAFWVE